MKRQELVWQEDRLNQKLNYMIKCLDADILGITANIQQYELNIIKEQHSLKVVQARLAQLSCS
jgi:hypothetical protein